MEEPIHTGASSTTGASVVSPSMSQEPLISLPSIQPRMLSGLPNS